MHRTEVFVMVVTQELEEWEDSKTIGRKRQWFSIEEALAQLALHKPTQRHYLQQLRHSKNNSTSTANCIHIVTDDPDDEPDLAEAAVEADGEPGGEATGEEEPTSEAAS